MRVFENTSNGYQESVSLFSILWTLLFGFIYLAIKGIWAHAIAHFLLIVALGSFTWGIAAIPVWLIYPLFVPSILARSYLKKGWREVA